MRPEANSSVQQCDGEGVDEGVLLVSALWDIRSIYRCLRRRHSGRKGGEHRVARGFSVLDGNLRLAMDDAKGRASPRARCYGSDRVGSLR